MSFRFLFIFIFCMSAFLNGHEEVQNVPSTKVPQFENEHVKVWKTTFLPRQRLKLHRHDKTRIVVGLKGGVLTKIEESGETSPLAYETGKAYWMPKDAQDVLHGDINESDEPIEVMIIEFKNIDNQ